MDLEGAQPRPMETHSKQGAESNGYTQRLAIRRQGQKMCLCCKFTTSPFPRLSPHCTTALLEHTLAPNLEKRWQMKEIMADPWYNQYVECCNSPCRSPSWVPLLPTNLTATDLFLMCNLSQGKHL